MTNENKGTIIIADDDGMILSMYNRFFGNAFPDFSVEPFPDGTSLVARLDKGIIIPTVVVTDNEMPGIQGRKIVEKYASQVPIILAYGGDKEIGEEAMTNGAYGFVKKPFEWNVFLDTIESALEASESWPKESSQ